MTIEEMKKRKQELGYTNEAIAELSNVPLGTVQKIFSGITQHPRYETLRALEKVFAEHAWDMVREPAVSYQIDLEKQQEKYQKQREQIRKTGYTRQGQYILKDYYELPEEQRVELIDGVIYDMGAPSSIHQFIASEIRDLLQSYIRRKKGTCIAFVSPIDVQLDQDERTMVQPDVLVVCDRDKIELKCIFGAPDFVAEIISNDSKKKDMFIKLNKYQNAGVREYWIVDPIQKKVLVYHFEKDDYPALYGFNSRIPVGIFNGECEVDFSEIYDCVKFIYEKE